MDNISRVPDALKTFPPAVSYIDTLRLWCPRPVPIASLLERWHGLIKIRRNRQWPGCGLIVNGPTEEMMHALAALRATITRCDPAYDWPAQSQAEADHYLMFHKRHLLLRYRRKGERQLWASGAVAWKRYRTSQRTGKNVMAYTDRWSKMAKAPFCCHLEIRFMTGMACRHAGLFTVSDLLKLNPSRLFARQLRLVTHPKARGSLTLFHDRHPHARLVDLPVEILRLPSLLSYPIFASSPPTTTYFSNIHGPFHDYLSP
jgi:hypothetical protein